MGFNTNGLNAAAAGLAGVITHISVHETIPDATGSAEVAGGSYTRQAITWAGPTNGVISNTAQLTHAIPAGKAAAFYGGWNAGSGGTF